MRTPVCELSPADWDQWWLIHHLPRLVADKEVAKFVAKVNPGRDMVAIDLACGNGQWTRQLVRLGLKVTGYDFSREALAQATRAGGTGPRLQYRRWDIDAEPIPHAIRPGTIDIVTCRDSLAFLDKGRLMGDVRRWLRPGTGRFYALTGIERGTVPRGGDEPGEHDEHRNPYRRGLTEEQFASLGQWGQREEYMVGPRLALVLTAPPT